MGAADTSKEIRSVALPDQQATETLAAKYARELHCGDVIALTGDLGTGKTVFARALIQARSKAAGVDIGAVPSPTYTLLQQYDLPGFSIYHFDLYRLSEPEEVWEIGLEEALSEGAALIEWADRAESYLPHGTIRIHLAPGPTEKARIAQISIPQ